MAKILYCWEMGEGLGHIMSLTMLVGKLKEMGHDVTCVLKNIESAPRLLAPLGIGWMQSPRVPPLLRRSSSRNHAELLHRVSYGSVDNVMSLFVAWKTIFRISGPDLVICDYAPTAALIAGKSGIDVICVDNGFSMPPVNATNLRAPLPPILPGYSHVPEELADMEERVLVNLNTALARMRMPELPAFASIFRSPVWYRNWPQLNHFGMHSPDRHLGPIFSEAPGIAPVWPKGKGPKMFAYLKAAHPGSTKILRSAIAYGFRVVAFSPDMPDSNIREFSESNRFVFSRVPFNLALLPDDVDIGVWHSPTGAVGRSIEKGIRMIFLPMHTEQILAGTAVARAGLNARIVTRDCIWTDLFDDLLAVPRKSQALSWEPADITAFASKLIMADGGKQHQ